MIEMSGNGDNIKKWLDGTMSDREKELFRRSGEFRSLEKLLNSLSSFKAPEFDVEAAFNRLSLDETARERKTKIYSLRPMLQAAAVLLLIIGTWYVYKYNSREIIQTGIAEKMEIILPDSSQVTLNASSRLAYHKYGWVKKREIKLEGEAFFRVIKGSKFVVKTGAGNITVLGTQFNVKDRENYFEVGCFEGSVQVQSSGQVLKLLPNQMFRVIDGVGNTIQILNESSPGWLTAESSFQSVPFREVLKEFERQYHVKFKTRDIETDKLFTGRFTHSDMVLALQSICIPLNLKYENTDDNYIILSPDRE